MKKTISKLLFAAVVLSMTAVAANAADPTVLIDFGADSGVNMGSKANNGVTFEETEDYALFTATGSDPYISMDDATGDFEQMKWVKVRVSNPSAATAIELFGSCNGVGLTGPECTHIDITPKTEEWKEYIAYIPDANIQTVQNYKDPQHWIDECYWNGEVSWIRLDPMWQEGDDGSDSGGSMASGEQIKIDYVAFFATEADAKAFTKEAAAPAPETTTPDAPAVDTGAAQTADMAAAAVLASVLALGTAVVVSKKR